MTRFCNDYIIASLIAIIVLVPLYFDIKLFSCFDLSKITALYILSFGITIAWCVKRIFDSKGRFEFNALAWPVFGLLIVGCLATIFSIEPLTSLLGSYKRYNGLLSLFVYIFLFFIIVHYVKMEMINLFLNVIIITGCVSCVYGLVEYYGLIGTVWNTNYGYGGRIFSTVGHPSFFSAFLIMVIPLVYYFIFKEKNWGFYLGALVLILITIYLCKTRASWLGFMVSTIFFFVFAIRRNRIKSIIIASLIIVITMVCGRSVIKRTMEDFRGGLSVSTYIKAQTAGLSLLTIKDYPVLGIGYDTFGTVYPYYLIQYIKKTDKNQRVFKEIQDRVHNNFFDVTVQTGLVGLAVYLWFIYVYGRMIWRNIARNRLLITALCSSVIGYFCSIQFCFGHIPTLTIYWMLLALSVIVCKGKRYGT